MLIVLPPLCLAMYVCGCVGVVVEDSYSKLLTMEMYYNFHLGGDYSVGD